MLFAAMLINASHATLEDAEIAFNCVGRYLLAAPAALGIFLRQMIHGFVSGKLAARFDIGVEFVGMQRALAGGINNQHVAQALAGQVLDFDGASATAAFHQRHGACI